MEETGSASRSKKIRGDEWRTLKVDSGYNFL